MYRGTRQGETHNYYTAEQVGRILRSIDLEPVNEVDTDYIVFCPFHSNFRSPAAEVSKESGWLYCFSCHASKSLQEVVMHVSNRTYFEAMRLIESKKNDGDISIDMNRMLEKKEEFVPFDELLIKRLNNQALDSARAMTYFERRGIYKDSVKAYLLGYSEKRDMVTIPITSPDGIYVGFVGRSIEGKEFMNTPGLPRSKTLFNISKAKRFDTVYVVESSFDAIRLEQIGVHAVATLGASVNRTQKQLLKKYFNNVIMLADNDEAGRSMAQRLKEDLGSIVITPKLPNSVKDVSDLNDQQLKDFVSGLDDPLAAVLQ